MALTDHLEHRFKVQSLLDTPTGFITNLSQYLIDNSVAAESTMLKSGRSAVW